MLNDGQLTIALPSSPTCCKPMLRTGYRTSTIGVAGEYALLFIYPLKQLNLSASTSFKKSPSFLTVGDGSYKFHFKEDLSQ